jgi:hypothetical protein
MNGLGYFFSGVGGLLAGIGALAAGLVAFIGYGGRAVAQLRNG